METSQISPKDNSEIDISQPTADSSSVTNIGDVEIPSENNVLIENGNVSQPEKIGDENADKKETWNNGKTNETHEGINNNDPVNEGSQPASGSEDVPPEEDRRMTWKALLGRNIAGIAFHIPLCYSVCSPGAVGMKRVDEKWTLYR